jgi:hypothetical protein
MSRAVVHTLAFLAFFCGGCAVETVDEQGALASSVDSATVTFGADWTQRLTGSLIAGRPVRIAYDPTRLPQCRGESNNLPAWAITGYFRVNGGAAQTFAVAPIVARSPALPVITLPNTTGSLELWFQVNNRWGCNAYDSNFGANYRFNVTADPRAPGWIGDGAVVISRATCNGLACDGDRRSITSPWTYETWARQRAAIRVVTFDVWKQGVTDFDNPNLWRQLDVQMFYRFGRTGAYRSQYVSFERRVGNNARYAVDLRTIDPLNDFPPLTACPPFALSPSPDGTLVSAALEYYFVVNGVDYRPGSGQTFQGVFSNYKTPLLASCLPR